MKYLIYLYKVLLCSALAVAIPLSAAAQGEVHISVTDSAAGTVLPDAVVRVVPLRVTAADHGTAGMTGRDGSYTTAYTGPSVILVSYLGYTGLRDTVRAAGSRSYQMVKSNAHIDDIVVTGQYGSGSARQSVYDVKVYTEKDFREKGAVNLRDALEGSVDIDLTEDKVFGSGISLQGISGEGVKILLDGVPLVGRNNGILDISQIDLSNIERIEVIKGPMSVIYGTDAMGGVVNLISKTSQKEKFNINVKGYYASVGKYNGSMNGGINLGKSQFFFSGGRNFFSGWSAVDTMRQKDWLPKEQYFGNLRYVYSTGKFRFGVSATFMRELMLDRHNLQPNTDYAFDTHYLTYRPTATLFATVPVSTASKLDLLASYSGYVQFLNTYQKDLVTLSEHIQSDQLQDTSVFHDIIARAIYTLASPTQKVSFQSGIDIDQEFSHQTLIASGHQSIGDYAVFASALWRPVRGLQVQPGVRFSYNTKFNTPLIPSLNVKYDLSRYITLRASYGLGYRAPSLQELFLYFHDGTNHDLNGNPNLKPETSNSVNMEMVSQFKTGEHRFKISTTAFFNQINDKIDYLNTPGTNIYTYFNINKYMTIGGEALAEYAWKRLALSTGVNCIWYHVYLGDSNLTAPKSIVSPDVTGRASYRIPKAEVEVAVSYKYTGNKLLYSLTNSYANQVGNAYSYYTLNVSLSRNIDIRKYSIQLTAGAKNILNVTTVGTSGTVAFGHESGTGQDIGMGRYYFVSLNLHFAK